MKNFILLSLLLSMFSANAQTESVAAMKNGYIIPNRGTLRILTIFAEVDYGDESCGPDLFTRNNGNTWGTNKKGTTQVPDDADWLFDQERKDEKNYQGYVTQFFNEASMGQYIVLGDYYPEVITVPCDQMSGSPYTHYKAIKNAVNALPGETLTSKNGYALKDFDLYDWNQNAFGHEKRIGKGEQKQVDILLIIWRNNIFLNTRVNNTNISCNEGFGLTQLNMKGNFKDMNGVQSVASYNGCMGAKGGALATVGEYFHGLFGGNHWHTAGGAGRYTFLNFPYSYSITGQQGIRTCAYDRWVMDWKGYADDEMKSYRRETIAALDTTRKTIATDLDASAPGKKEYSFILRDFMQYGDAVRIKLPYLKTEDSMVKNQYIWLENHQMKTRFDRNKFDDHECTDKPKPGIYAYVQVGKDVLQGPKMYTSSPKHPNGIGSWIMPLTAEGNYDFHYREDLKTKSGDCVWGNHSLPSDRFDRRTKPNPFTGFSDVFFLVNSTKDLILQPSKFDCKKDCWQPGISEVDANGELKHNLNAYGDSEDAFQSGSTIDISSNPAPVPVYTYTSNPFPKGYPDKMKSYENRKIWLNGISIEVLDQIYNSNIKANDLLVRVRFDQFTITKKSRWCGNIELSPNVFSSEAPSLVINKGVEVALDRGTSPTQHVGVEPGKAGTWYFTKKTKLNLRPASYMHLKERSKLTITAGSRMKVQKGAKLVSEAGAYISISGKSKLEFAMGALVELDPATRIEVSNNSTIIVHDPALKSILIKHVKSPDKIRVINTATDGSSVD